MSEYRASRSIDFTAESLTRHLLHHGVRSLDGVDHADAWRSDEEPSSVAFYAEFAGASLARLVDADDEVEPMDVLDDVLARTDELLRRARRAHLRLIHGGRSDEEERAS